MSELEEPSTPGPEFEIPLIPFPDVAAVPTTASPALEFATTPVLLVLEAEIAGPLVFVAVRQELDVVHL
jgi:hypothetical protein